MHGLGNAIARGVFESRRWVFLLVICLIALLKTGVWVQPNLDVTAMIATSPFQRHSGVSYLAENWLDPFIGWLVGARTWQSLALVDVVFSAGFLAVMFVVLFRSLPDRSARVASLVFIALPVSTTSFYWVGLDSLTLLLLALALLVMKRWWLVLPVGLLLGMQHAEQGIAAALLVAGVRFLGVMLRQRGWVSLIFPATLAVGVVIGRGVLNLIYAACGITIEYDRADWFKDNLGPLVRQYLENPLLIWYSVLGVGWLVVIRFATEGRRSIPLMVGVAVLCVASILYSDQTRVAAVIGLLMVTTELLLDGAFLAKISEPQVVVFAIVWAIVPFIWVWGAIAQPPMFVYSLEVALHRVFGWPQIPSPSELRYWPFVN